LLPIDFSYMTSYRLSIVTFALGRTVQPQYITSQTDDDDDDVDRRNSVAIARLLVRSANHTITGALAAKPEAEIWRKHVQSISRPWFPIRPPLHWWVYLQPFSSSKRGLFGDGFLPTSTEIKRSHKFELLLWRLFQTLANDFRSSCRHFCARSIAVKTFAIARLAAEIW